MAQLAVTAHVLKQKGFDLYLFPMNSQILKQICYVTPQSKADPDEVQRILDPKRAQQIGKYIQDPPSILPNALVVSLTDDVVVRPTGRDSEVTLEFPDETGKFAYVLDGQHRLEGFKYSDGVEFDLPVVALYKADEHLRGKVFADINSKQVKVSDVHLLSLYYKIKELPSDSAATMDVIQRLATDADSPLVGKIKTSDDDKGAWVTNRHMKMCVGPHTESGGILYGLNSPAAQAQVMKEYLKGIQRMWPEAWGDNKDYMLTRPMGMELMLSVFAAVSHRCDLNLGRQYTAENFEKSLAPLKDCEIEIPGGGKLTLTWQRGPFGTLSGRAGRVLMQKQLTDRLRSADENSASHSD